MTLYHVELKEVIDRTANVEFAGGEDELWDWLQKDHEHPAWKSPIESSLREVERVVPKEQHDKETREFELELSLRRAVEESEIRLQGGPVTLVMDASLQELTGMLTRHCFIGYGFELTIKRTMKGWLFSALSNSDHGFRKAWTINLELP